MKSYNRRMSIAAIAAMAGLGLTPVIGVEAIAAAAPTPVICVGGNGDTTSGGVNGLANATRCTMWVNSPKSVLDGGGTLSSTQPGTVAEAVRLARSVNGPVVCQGFSYGAQTCDEVAKQLSGEKTVTVLNIANPNGGINATGGVGVLNQLPFSIPGIMNKGTMGDTGGQPSVDVCIRHDGICDSTPNLNAFAALDNVVGYFRYHVGQDAGCNYVNTSCGGAGTIVSRNGNKTSVVINAPSPIVRGLNLDASDAAVWNAVVNSKTVDRVTGRDASSLVVAPFNVVQDTAHAIADGARAAAATPKYGAAAPVLQVAAQVADGVAQAFTAPAPRAPSASAPSAPAQQAQQFVNQVGAAASQAAQGNPQLQQGINQVAGIVGGLLGGVH